MSAPFKVNAVLRPGNVWQWRVVRSGHVIARCSSKRYADRIAQLLNADEAQS